MKAINFVQLRRIFLQGFKNLMRNRMMIFASFLVTTVTMVVLGVCYMVSQNINYQIDSYISKEYTFSIYLQESIGDEEAKVFARRLEQDPRVQDYTYVSKKQAFEDFKSNFPKDSFEFVFEGKDMNFLPVSFNVTLVDSKLADTVIQELQVLNFKELGIPPGEGEDPLNEVVREYSSTESLMATVQKVRNIVNIVGVAATAVLIFFAVIIISNTIMQAVFARRKEIQIMNHIGATRLYIEGPFIVEGGTIGFLGAVVSYFLLQLLYGVAVNIVGSSYTASKIFGIELIGFSELSSLLLGGLILVGMLIGSFGAMLSAGKYIKN